MKLADKTGAAHVLIIGDKELEQGKGLLRNMETRQQAELVLETAPILATFR
jgi:histidyl-tRNA synthetase